MTLLGDGCILFLMLSPLGDKKHWDELATMLDKGYRSVMFHLIMVGPEGDYSLKSLIIDADYKTKLLRAVADKGVELLAY